MYKITFTKLAFKELSKIPEPFYLKIKSAIIQLSDNPRPIGSKKLKGRDGYRIRIGNYRVIYEIFDTQLIINIINIGHRKDIYH